MNNNPVCRAEHINHIGIAVKDINSTLEFYKTMFGAISSGIEDIEDQGVKSALVRVGASQLEFIQPTDENGGVARFIESRGETVHHICFEVDDLQGKLDKYKLLQWDSNYCMNVVMASKGYPESYKTNTIIKGLNEIAVNKSEYIFHSSTKKNNNQWLATGGRVISLSALGSSLKNAKDNVYNTIKKIDWKDSYYRKDIGWRHL